MKTWAWAMESCVVEVVIVPARKKRKYGDKTNNEVVSTRGSAFGRYCFEASSVSIGVKQTSRSDGRDMIVGR